MLGLCIEPHVKESRAPAYVTSCTKGLQIWNIFAYFILEIEKLLAPNASISLNVILYPFGPLVNAKDNESILNGSIFGRLISGIPRKERKKKNLKRVQFYVGLRE